MRLTRHEPPVQDEHGGAAMLTRAVGGDELDLTLADDPMRVLAHELRSPLSAIAGAVELLARQQPSLQQVSQCAAVVRRQMATVKAILQDLTARGDSVASLADATVDVRHCVEDAVESCQPLLRERRHELVVTMPPVPVWWTGERSRLVRCVVNLIDNAAHYTDAGGHIGVALEARRGQLALSVTDDGIGLSGDALCTIFRPHVRAAASAALHPDGHGIGLAVVDEIARASGGRVQATSAGRGCGSTFTLLLPTAAILEARDVPGARN